MKAYTLITGASSGLGREFALAYAKKGQNLILMARREERLLNLKEQLSSYPVDIQIAVVDLSKKEEIDLFFSQLDQDSTINRIINNAGFGYAGQFIYMKEESLNQMNQLNMNAVSLLINKCIPEMLSEQEGEIMNIASVAGFSPGPYMANYYATKAYVLSLGRALHKEFKDLGIKITTVCPGPVRTEFFEVASEKQPLLLEKFAMSPRQVVNKSVKALEKNKAVLIPGFRNKMTVFLFKVMPVKWVLPFVAFVQKSKTKRD